MIGRDLRNLVVGAVIASAGLYAVAAVSVPNTFSPGQVISAAQVNANFASLSAGINAVEAKTDGLASRFGGGMESEGTGSGGCTADGFIGEVFMFAGTFPPRGTVPADGRLLPIASNTALFSLFGTTYGGNGTTTFAVPDLRDVSPRSSNGATVSYFVCTGGIFPSRD
jgi:hypothetical protein